MVVLRVLPVGAGDTADVGVPPGGSVTANLWPALYTLHLHNHL